MRLYFRLAWRNLWRHRRRTLIVVLSIGLTLCMMMWYDGIVTGFNDAIYGNAIKVLGGNIQIHASGYESTADQNPMLPLTNEQAILDLARAQPQVQAAAARIQTGGLATNREGAFAVSIVGLDPQAEQSVNMITSEVSEGRFLTAQDADMIYIGKGLAEAMSLKVGDRFTLAGSAPKNQMRTRTMTVVGIFDLGMSEIEKNTVYMSLAEAQNLYDLPGQVTEIVLYLKKIGQEFTVIDNLKSAQAEFDYSSWQTLYPELQSALATKGAVMSIFGIIMLVIAGIGIFNLLLMAVFERTREIGILGALGMKPRHISLLFLIEGGLMGLVGVAFGMGLGLALNLLLGQVGLDYSKFANLTEYTAFITGRIYPSLGLEKIWLRAVTAIVIAILASYYPAREAAKREPAESLHFV